MTLNGDSGHQTRRATDAQADALSKQYLTRLLAADRRGAEEVIELALKAGIEPTAIQVLIVGAAMERVGRLWERDEISVADEHLATAISHQVLIRLLDALHTAAPGSRENVLLAAVEGQQHVLGLRMVADVLEGAGFNVLYLGADVPVPALKRFAAEHNPVVTGLAFGVPLNVSNLVESVFAVRESAPTTRLMLGGRAAPRDLSATGMPWIANSLDVLDRVKRLIAEPPRDVPGFFHALRGKITAATSAPDEPVSETEAVAARLADIAAESSEISREYARRAESYRDLAQRDPVTNLANRRAFDDKIHSHAAEAAGQGSLLLVDVDDFKGINDTRGHGEGDRLLRVIAESIADTVRPGDFCARIGGDEFAVLLPTATLRDAQEVGDRIRRAVAQLPDRPPTVSIGATPVTDDARATLLAVDEALYAAKGAGRDTVVAAERPGASAEADHKPRVADDAPAPGGNGAPGGETVYVSMSKLRVSNDRADELVAAFRARARLVDDADGFINLEVWQSDRDGGELLMVSRWRSREAFKNYMKSAEHKTSHGRIDPDLKSAIKLMALEHMHTYEVVAE